MSLAKELHKLILEHGEEKVLSELAKQVNASVTYTYEDLDDVYFGWGNHSDSESKEDRRKVL
jgi:hypothetical protein